MEAPSDLPATTNKQRRADVSSALFAERLSLPARARERRSCAVCCVARCEVCMGRRRVESGLYRPRASRCRGQKARARGLGGRAVRLHRDERPGVVRRPSGWRVAGSVGGGRCRTACDFEWGDVGGEDEADRQYHSREEAYARHCRLMATPLGQSLRLVYKLWLVVRIQAEALYSPGLSSFSGMSSSLDH